MYAMHRLGDRFAACDPLPNNPIGIAQFVPGRRRAECARVKSDDAAAYRRALIRDPSSRGRSSGTLVRSATMKPKCKKGAITRALLIPNPGMLPVNQSAQRRNDRATSRVRERIARGRPVQLDDR